MTSPWSAPQLVGDEALRVELAVAERAAVAAPAQAQTVHAAVHTLTRDPLDGVGEVTPGYVSILVRFDALRTDPYLLAERLAARLRQAALAPTAPPREVAIPVCYGGELGPDLDALARHCGMSPAQVIAAHSTVEYPVAFLGFAPGFPYLLGLPSELYMPRHATPRTSVPAGSVAIAGSQAGIYPQRSPGGWQLLGRTPLPLVSLGEHPTTRLRLGDRVRFLPHPLSDWPSLVAEFAPPTTSPDPTLRHAPALTVLAPGVLSTVQDLGRPGFGHLGLSAGGSADPLALRLANRLVGNPDGAAGLELTLRGPELRAERDLDFALIGAVAATIDGQPIASGVTQTLRRGQVLACGPLQPGLRGYLALRGGLRLPPIAGSLATDLRGGFGGLSGRALQRGDVLHCPPPSTPQPLPCRALSPIGHALLTPANALRVTWGAQADWFPASLRERLSEQVFVVTPQSNRSGLRLQIATDLPRSSSGLARGSLLSEGMSPGTLQVPSDGQPILLGVESGTTGGYPGLAQVIRADLPLLGRLRPGERITLQPVSFADAVAAQRGQLAALEQAIEERGPDRDRSLS